jgi:glycosyltransferase involved in cell wall biosynthesis
VATPLSVVMDTRRVRDFGPGTYITNLVKALGKIDRENRYTLVSHRKDSGIFAGLPANFELRHFEGADIEVSEHFRFPMFLRGLPADVYHIPAALVPFFMPRPYVVTVHDVSRILYDAPAGWRGDLRRYRFRRGLTRAAGVMAVSGATRADCESLLGVPLTHMETIYNAPDPRFFEHAPPADARAGGPETYRHETRRILERYQIETPFLLYAGTIRPQKNIPRLVEAFSVVRAELENHPVYSNLRLAIIGDDISRHPAVRRAVAQTRVGNFVRFLGFVPFDTLRVFYEAATAFVFPSLYEGFGLPPIEAMASGTPVITSNVSSLPEVVGEAAMIVNPENVFDIAKGIKEVLLDDELRLRLIRAGIEQARKFSWEETARRVLAVYRRAAKR